MMTMFSKSLHMAKCKGTYYTFFPLTYKVSPTSLPIHLHNLVFVQSASSTRSSSAVTFSRHTCTYLITKMCMLHTVNMLRQDFRLPTPSSLYQFRLSQKFQSCQFSIGPSFIRTAEMVSTGDCLGRTTEAGLDASVPTFGWAWRNFTS